ncbi:hypothetical protein FOXG_22179 [Fusarium oxysporum f. sp. lycopersici 4287]|uniref:Transcription factor domain-containing protein n=1 Tax=Fusarium oxysporum f. sp. lycopersici (strain 4287 / CBS 123668 / FGSC 9935 / NRRL 34936) TaxID=426428 RepID=A0A0J9WUS5_FUSO4|nr:hypothetical protein FOXG_22045 [Fusarium oxysporum f. sp. lycopersici 4287]XP_018256337.1 uncharacterized protein FOXG_22179 [Fusarium oxysporum f. sp. lycopersici 4287]KNB17777.1 hypothetical protein FOXG_22045 [Fusarium oxysporum f. sp. lycopersici 4287]KNB18292.1 hypothetical protein FOXG_22179 [Fusarium oxysporum f. sp. lycopersici 4287]
MVAFVFITSTGRPGQAESEVDRHGIRRHTMRSMAIARRAKGDYGQHNRRQLPLFLEPTASKVKENTSLQQELFNSALEVAHMVPSPLSAQGYELAKLTPTRLQKLAQLRHPSWLDFVPARYAESGLLQAAVDCTLARAHRSLHPDSGISETAVVKLYLKALSQLQEALGDKLERRWARADVLCAIKILAFYEFLQFSQSAQWLHHITGAQKLMRLRGPENYSTDFEQQMLMSQTGTIFHESMSIGEDCFLEELKWKALLSSIATVERPTNIIKSLDCHPVLSSLWIHASPAARLFRQTSVCVNGTGANDPGTILQLILEAYQTCQNLLTWREDFVKFAAELQPDRHSSRLRELLGVSFAVQIVLNRLIIALQPRAAAARTFENETQAFADRIIVLCHEATEESLPISNMLLAEKIVIANATKESEDDWMWAVSGETYSTCQGIQCIPATIFEQWYIALGSRDVD